MSKIDKDLRNHLKKAIHSNDNKPPTEPSQNILIASFAAMVILVAVTLAGSFIIGNENMSDIGSIVVNHNYYTVDAGNIKVR